jgi:hypothetical protein
MQKDHVLTCPDCGSIVPISSRNVEGTVEKGGHGILGAEYSAKCPKTDCGRVFEPQEIDSLGYWA